MALSTQPYKGARDFYPEDKRLQKYMFAIWRSICERYGYEEYDAPVLEPLDIYLAKTGEEIVNEQTYAFEDRGGRKVVIRPEMTPTVSRMVAGRRQELAYPLRWYSIPNLWRYERPQRGRLREHWQLNVDIFGVKDQGAELEMILLVDDVFRAFGASEDMYEIRVNNRQLVEFILKDYLELGDESAHNVSKLIDRMAKLEHSKFLSQLDEALDAAARKDGAAEKLLAILAAKDISGLPQPVREHESAMELQMVLKSLQFSGVENARYDASLMRGFDYYTGIVFEVFDKHPDNNRSMLGGGRYDGLVGLFGVQPVPTVGFGWGDVTLANFLELHRLLPKFKVETDVYVAVAGDYMLQAQSAASQLRARGVRVAVDLSGRKLGDQIKTADKKGIAYVLVVGEDELKSGTFSLKDLETGKEQSLPLEKIVDVVKPA